MGPVMQLQKGTRRQGIQAASKETHSPQGLRKECALRTPISDIWPPEMSNSKFVLFKPLGLGYLLQQW